MARLAKLGIAVVTSWNGRGVLPEDHPLALAGLADRLEGQWRAEAGFGDEVGRVKAQAIDNYRHTLGIYESFPGIIRAAMPRDALWVRDITFSQTTWANRIFPVYGPRDSIYSVSAAIGTGLPLAIGAALAANGRKTVAMCGDGGFWLNLGELWTAVQEQVDVCFLLMSDQGYGVIRHIQDASYGGRHFYDDLLGPNLEDLAKLAGVPYWRVRSLDELGGHLSAALQARGPTLVEVDMGAIGPFRPQHQVPASAGKR